MPQVRVLIVSGPPAAGKTVLAAKLGAALGWPVFAKDAIKEVLYDHVGVGDAAFSGRLGVASIMLLFAMAEWELAARRSCILESNFHRDYDPPCFAALERRYGCAVREVHCTATAEALRARLRARWESGTRHPGHVKDANTDALDERLVSGAHAPMLPPAHRITVDTTDFATVDDAAVLAAVRTLIRS